MILCKPLLMGGGGAYNLTKTKLTILRTYITLLMFSGRIGIEGREKNYKLSADKPWTIKLISGRVEFGICSRMGRIGEQCGWGKRHRGMGENSERGKGEVGGHRVS